MWFLPTFNAPHLCQQVLDAVIETAPESSGFVVVDGGNVDGYRSLRLPQNWQLQIEHENLGVVGRLNWCFAQFPDLPFYGFLSQDTVPITKGWDAALENTAGAKNIASSNDGWQAPKRMHGAVCFGGDVIRAWGYWVPPIGLIHSFCDDFWECVGRSTGIWRVRMDIMVEHRHAGNGKSTEKTVYERAYQSLEQDKSTWNAHGEKWVKEACRSVRKLWNGRWFLPSYQRPELCQQALDSFAAQGWSTQGTLIVNGRDPRYDDIRLPDGWDKIVIEKNEGVVKAMNFAFAKYPSLDWYGCVTDDLVAKTTASDQVILDNLALNGMASCLDNFRAPARIGGAVAFGGDLLRNWGFWFIPDLYHGHADEFWEIVGHDWKNWRIAHDALVEHLSPLGGKRAPDAVHDEVYKRAAEDRPIFDAWIRENQAAVYDRMGALIPWMGVKVRHSDLSGLSVAFATPAYGDQYTGAYVTSLMGSATMLAQQGVGMAHLTRPNDSMIDRARNVLVRQFLFQTDCTHMLFVDADMGWDADAPLRLLAHGYDLVAAVGMRKQDGPPSFCWLEKPGAKVDPQTGCIPVTSVGTGFMLISRRLLQLMWDTSPELIFMMPDNVDYRALFQAQIFGNASWSEDYTFCLRAAKCGIEVMADPAITLAHVGNRAWVGSPRMLERTGA